MKRKTLVKMSVCGIFLLGVIVFILPYFSVHAHYNSDWPMFRHDLQNTGYTTCTMPDDLTLLWKYETGGSIDSSPAVVNGYVYIGSDDTFVYCLTADTGEVVWTYKTGDTIYSSPAVVNGYVYIGSDDTFVYCLTADTGEVVWTYKTGDAVWASPAVVDGKVYFGSGDKHIYCLTADTGEQVWSYEIPVWVPSSPAVADGNVYIGARDRYLYCLTADTGELLWAHNDTIRAFDRMRSSPTVFNGKAYIAYYAYPCCNSYLYCMDSATGELLWWFAPGEEIVYGSPAVAYGKVYLGSGDNFMYCLTEAGELVWKYETGDDIASSPAVADGKVYIGSYDYYVYCFDAETGTVLWKYRTNGKIGKSAPAVADGRLYIGSYDGCIYCFGEKESTVPLTEESIPVASSETPAPTLEFSPAPATSPPVPMKSNTGLYILLVGILVVITVIAYFTQRRLRTIRPKK